MSQSRRNEVKIFSGEASSSLAVKIAEEYGVKIGEASVQHFSDGEFQPSFNESVRGCDVFIVQSTFAPSDNLLELLLMVDAAKRASAHYVTAVIPYFGLARQDRKDKPRVAIGARLVADLLSTAGVTRVMTMDLHAPQIQGFFNVPVDHLDSASVLIPEIVKLGLKDLTICAPDMGATPRARHFNKTLKVDMVVCDKHRKQANVIESITLIGDVKGKNVVIVDDIIDTAGTICKVAETIMDNGALSVRAFCTHAVLSGDAYNLIEKSALLEVVVTDTIPLKRQSPKIRQVSVDKLFAKAIKSVNEHSSIQSLFDVQNTPQ